MDAVVTAGALGSKGSYAESSLNSVGKQSKDIYIQIYFALENDVVRNLQTIPLSKVSLQRATFYV